MVVHLSWFLGSSAPCPFATFLVWVDPTSCALGHHFTSFFCFWYRASHLRRMRTSLIWTDVSGNYPARTIGAVVGDVRPYQGVGGNTTANMHVLAHVHAQQRTHTDTHTRTHNCARIDNVFMCLLKQLAWASLSHPTFLQPAATTGRMVEMVTFVASWYDCTSKQSGYVQLSVREDSEKSVDRMFAFGPSALRNYDLICIVLFCLIALLFLMICVVPRCYCTWSVFKRQISVIWIRQFWIIVCLIKEKTLHVSVRQ